MWDRKMIRFFAVLLVICTLLMQGNMVIFAAEKTGVDLYKSTTFLGNYDTLNEAFDLMKDTTADYTVVLNESQTLYGYAQWPKVNSIKLKPVLNYSEYAMATEICITEESTTFNSDVCFDDWIAISPPKSGKETFFYDIDIQNHEVTFDCEQVGHYVTVGDTYYVSGFNFKGDEHSKMIVTTGTQFWNSSIQVDTVEFLTTKRNGDDTWGWITLYQCPQKNSINNLIITDPNEENCHMNMIDVRGYSDIKAVLEVNNIEFDALYEYKDMVITAEGNAEVIVGDMSPDIDMEFRYNTVVNGMGAQKTSTFTYLGDDAKRIFVTSSYAPHVTIGPEELYNVVSPDTVLLYAPNLASEKIDFLLYLQQEFGNVVAGGYTYSGQLPCESGYYYSNNVPNVYMDRIAYIVEGACSETLSYELMNGKEDLVSVDWKVESFWPPYNGTALEITDYDKSHVDFSLSEADQDYRLIGTFDYGYGEGRVDIPMFISATVTDASLSATEVHVECNEDELFQMIELNLNYTAEETPKILLYSSNSEALNGLMVNGNTITGTLWSEGTYTIYVCVGDQIIECQVIGTAEKPSKPSEPEKPTEPEKPAIVEGWKKDNVGWWYQNADGTYPSSCWKMISGKWYAFDGRGYMREGWFYDAGQWYYLIPGSGQMATGWIQVGGTWYYMNSSGAMATGWVKDGNTWYYMKSSGAMATGWVKDGGTWYYMKSSGAMATGWVKDGNTWYYMKSSGAMATGWVKDGNTWYYMKSSGAMATGWILDGGTWYYLNSSGAWIA